jgi:alpha-L-fucosidase
MTITRQWAWKPQDELKTAKQSLDALIRAAGGDGNLLYNVGPMPDGRIEPRQVEVLEEMGDWLDKYGHTIYGTRGGPYLPADWGVTTRKDNKMYLHLLNWFGDGGAVIVLPTPDGPVKIKHMKLVTPVGLDTPLSARTQHGLIRIVIPAKARQPIDTIVELELDRDVMAMEPVAPRAQSLSYGKPATASSQTHFGTAESAFNGDWVGHGWRPAGDDKQPWLAVDLGEPTQIKRILVLEDGDRIRKFKIESKTGGDWTTVHSGATVGSQVEIPINITAQHLRVTVTESTGTPALRELLLF